MKTKILIATIMASFFVFANITIYAQNDVVDEASTDVSSVLDAVLKDKKKEVVKAGNEKEQLQDSLKKERNSYQAKLDLESRKMADSLLLIDTESELKSLITEYQKQTEIEKDSSLALKLAIKEIANLYDPYGAKEAVSGIIQTKLDQLNIFKDVKIIQEDYLNKKKFFNLDAEKERDLIKLNDNKISLQKKLMQLKDRNTSLQRLKESQMTIFKNFKEKYEKLNNEMSEEEKTEMSDLHDQYKFVTSALQTLYNDCLKDETLDEDAERPMKTKVKNIFKQVGWKFYVPEGTNRSIIEAAREQALTIANGDGTN